MTDEKSNASQRPPKKAGELQRWWLGRPAVLSEEKFAMGSGRIMPRFAFRLTLFPFASCKLRPCPNHRSKSRLFPSSDFEAAAETKMSVRCARISAKRRRRRKLRCVAIAPSMIRCCSNRACFVDRTSRHVDHTLRRQTAATLCCFLPTAYQKLFHKDGETRRGSRGQAD